MENEKEIITDWKEQYIQLLADFTNFRKNKEKEISEIKKNAENDLIIKLIPILDDIDIIIRFNPNNEDFITLKKKLMEVLEPCGLFAYCEKGDFYNDELHEAITMTSDNEVESGCVSHIVKCGYKLNNKIVRHAQVFVER